MDRHEIQVTIDDLHRRYPSLDGGAVATYIPELGKANPDDFGVTIATTDGRVFEVGDCQRAFSIQILD